MKPPNIISFFLLCLAFFFSAESWGADNELFRKAERLYQKGLWGEAARAYDTLISRQEVATPVLLRAAYLAEKTEQPGMAIFYLQKICTYSSSPELFKRIADLQEKTNATAPLVNEFPYWSVGIKRNAVGILLFSLMLLGLVLLFYRKSKSPHKGTASLSAVALILLLQLTLGAMFLFEKDYGLLKQSATFYEAPAYAATAHNDLVAVGSILKIYEKQDIWYQVEVGGSKYWVSFLHLGEL